LWNQGLRIPVFVWHVAKTLFGVKKVSPTRKSPAHERLPRARSLQPAGRDATRLRLIRKGFEYQDLYRAVQILAVIEQNPWATGSRIESHQVDLADDLEIVSPDGDAAGHQVKFQTTLEHEDSITTLTKQKTKPSRSLIQKLHAGWQRLTLIGERGALVCLVTRHNADRLPSHCRRIVRSQGRKRTEIGWRSIHPAGGPA